jgi:CRP-like cAMP-binding protein
VDQGKTIIIVTHDSGLAKQTHRTALIADGEIVNEYVSTAMPTLTQEQVWQATHSAKRLSFEPGAMILTEGTNAEAFYIVAKGTVEVILPRENQSDVVALQLGPGQYFGEIEFFHKKRHSASIRAYERGPVEVLCITYDELNELLGRSPVTREALQSSASKHEAENIARRNSGGVPGREPTS